MERSRWTRTRYWLNDDRRPVELRIFGAWKVRIAFAQESGRGQTSRLRWSGPECFQSFHIKLDVDCMYCQYANRCSGARLSDFALTSTESRSFTVSVWVFSLWSRMMPILPFNAAHTTAVLPVLHPFAFRHDLGVFFEHRLVFQSEFMKSYITSPQLIYINTVFVEL